MTGLNNKSILYGDIFLITDSWTDSEGDSWFKVEWHIGAYVEGAKARQYKLSKISNAGRTLEFVLSKIEYPTEIDPKHSDYHIHYRQ